MMMRRLSAAPIAAAATAARTVVTRPIDVSDERVRRETLANNETTYYGPMVYIAGGILGVVMYPFGECRTRGWTDGAWHFANFSMAR